LAEEAWAACPVSCADDGRVGLTVKYWNPTMMRIDKAIAIISRFSMIFLSFIMRGHTRLLKKGYTEEYARCF
jgi:hypothetical protein